LGNIDFVVSPDGSYSDVVFANGKDDATAPDSIGNASISRYF
jgi:hypothetical protein